MKKVTFLSAAALLFTLGLSNDAFAQPGGYGQNRYPQQSPDYRQQPAPNYPQNPGYNQPPVAQAPVIIVDADGRRNNDRDNNFNNYETQAGFDRWQRNRLERRYGFVPPLVMFVPDRFVNRFGDYVSQAGLVYHRGRDNYFHLDKRYYNDRWDDYSYNDNRNNNDRNDRRWNDNRRY